MELNFTKLISEGVQKINESLLNFVAQQNRNNHINLDQKTNIIINKNDSNQSEKLNQLYYNRFYNTSDHKPLKYQIQYDILSDIGLCENNIIKLDLNIILLLVDNHLVISKNEYKGFVKISCNREYERSKIKRRSNVKKIIGGRKEIYTENKKDEESIRLLKKKQEELEEIKESNRKYFHLAKDLLNLEKKLEEINLDNDTSTPTKTLITKVVKIFNPKKYLKIEYYLNVAIKD